MSWGEERGDKRNRNENVKDAQRIRDYEQWLKSLRNYAWVRDVAPGATDLDLVIERRGHFLVLEGKTWHDGVHVPRGQHIMFKELCALDAFDVYLVGETHAGQDGTPDDAPPFYVLPYQTYTPYDRGAHVVFPAGLFEPATDDDMRQLVRLWMRKAER